MWQRQQQWLQIAFDSVSVHVQAQMASYSGSIWASQGKRTAQHILVAYHGLGTFDTATSTNNSLTDPGDLDWQRVELANSNLCQNVLTWKVSGDGLLHVIELFLAATILYFWKYPDELCFISPPCLSTPVLRVQLCTTCSLTYYQILADPESSATRM